MYGIFALAWLLPVAFIGGIVFLIIYLVRRKPGQPASTDFKKLGVGAAITLISPFFIGFFTSAIFNELESTDSFITMVIMALLFIIVSLFIANHSVISYSLIAGSIISLIYSTALNFETVDPKIMAVFAGIALAIVIIIAFKKLHDKEVI